MSNSFNDWVHGSKPRNAQAVAAWERKAGPMSKRGRPYPDDVITPLEEALYDLNRCTECGKDMGFEPPSILCAPCELTREWEER